MTTWLLKLASVTVCLALTAPPLAAISPVPRKSPEFSIVEPSGKETLLSSFKGKVVLLEFLVTNCQHCQRVSQGIARLHQELGPRGFQALGIAINDGVTARIVTDYVLTFGITFPVGSSPSWAADSYLGRSAGDLLSLPQIVVIDRRGVIRAQSAPRGDAYLEDENRLRNLIDGLLKESPATTPKNPGR